MKYLKLLLIAPFFIGLLVTVQNINVKDNANELSLTLQNVEALASGESGGRKVQCYVTLKQLSGAKSIECYDCQNIDNYYGYPTSSYCYK